MSPLYSWKIKESSLKAIAQWRRNRTVHNRLDPFETKAAFWTGPGWIKFWYERDRNLFRTGLDNMWPKRTSVSWPHTFLPFSLLLWTPGAHLSFAPELMTSLLWRVEYFRLLSLQQWIFFWKIRVSGMRMKMITYPCELEKLDFAASLVMLNCSVIVIQLLNLIYAKYYNVLH